MAEPVSTALVMMLKTVGKAVAKEIAAASATAVKAGTAGKVAKTVDAVAKSLTEVQKLNILRAKVDPKMVGKIAKSLGMTPKELTAITDKLRLTKARKLAVTGRNYIRNINKFTKTPYRTISEYTRKELNRTVKEKAEDVTQDARERARRMAVINALKMLEGKIQKIDPTFNLSSVVWEQVENIQIEDVYTALTYVEMDLYGDSGQQETEHIFLDSTHKGYMQGMEQSEFQQMIEDMMLQGFHSKMIDGIY